MLRRANRDDDPDVAVLESCRRRAERDILTRGRYALEFHVLAADGRPVAAPFRITGKDC